MKDAYYFSHDANARNDIKIKAMRKRYGAAGYGRFWILIEYLREQEDYVLEMDDLTWIALSEEFGVDEGECKKFVEDLINVFRLLETDGNVFWSPSLHRRMEYKDSVSQKRAEAGRKGAQKRWQANTEENAATKGEEEAENGKTIAKNSKNIANDSNDIAKHSNERKGKERKGKEKKEDIEADISAIIIHLNETADRKFDVKTKSYRKMIAARLNEGHTLDDCQKVIELQTIRWRGDPKMERFLSPDTLFRASKFPKYLEEVRRLDGNPAKMQEFSQNLKKENYERQYGHRVEQHSVTDPDQQRRVFEQLMQEGLR